MRLHVSIVSSTQSDGGSAPNSSRCDQEQGVLSGPSLHPSAVQRCPTLQRPFSPQSPLCINMARVLTGCLHLVGSRSQQLCVKLEPRGLLYVKLSLQEKWDTQVTQRHTEKLSILHTKIQGHRYIQ